MKPNLYLPLACLCCLTFLSIAQERDSPARQQELKIGMKIGLRTHWNEWGNNLLANGLQNDPEILAAWGMSAEQFRQTLDTVTTARKEAEETPEYKRLYEETAMATPEDPFMQNADEETQKKFQNIIAKMDSLTNKAASDALDKVLTPEQKQKMGETRLATMGEMPVITPSVFEVLNLTDAQKQQMENIKKKLEPEFERYIDNFVNGQLVFKYKFLDELKKRGGYGEDIKKTVQAIRETLMAKDPEYKKLYDELQAQRKAFTTQFQVEMFDVLTDEQWNRLLKLIDDPPEHVMIFRKKMQERNGIRENAAWQPGPNSWKPGDAIPEQYRIERNERRRFPKTESE